MRILFFIRKFNDSTHTFIYNTLQGIVDRGHKVKVLCVQRLYPDKYPFDDVEIADFSITQRIIANRMHHWGVKLKYKNKPLASSISKSIATFKPDAIHCHFGPDGLYFLDNYTGNLPVLIHFHGFDASNLLSDKLYRNRLNEIFKKSNVFPIFVSQFMYKNIKKSGINPNWKKILYYGTDLSFFTPTKKAKSHTKKFLQVSSLREKKGHIYTLKAFASWHKKKPNKKWELILTGDGPNLKKLQRIAKQLNINNHIKWVGFVNRKQTKDLMENADIFIHHSITAQNGDMEGIPNAIMEAMAMKLPILSTKHAGIPELVEDKVHGYLVEERDIDTYAQRIEDIYSWPKQDLNREKVYELFSKKKHAENLEKIYSEAILKTEKNKFK